jgi:nucleoside-diphosphate-sugar epimerase
VKAFLTGGTGFIGGWLAERLVRDGWEVCCLARRTSDTRRLDALGVEIVMGSILEPDSMRAGMRDAGAVFHVAALYKIGHPDADLVFRTNVEGTRNVLDLARELEVPRVLHCSTAGVLGATHGEPLTEYSVRSAEFTGPYEWSKYVAHLEAVRRGMRGEPVTIAMPGAVFGPRDTGLVGWMLQKYVQGKLPALMDTGGKFTFVHVEDVVDGMLRIHAEGIPGTGYVLADETMSIGDFMRGAARIVGKALPRTVGLRTLKLIRPFYELAARLRGEVPLLSKEAIALLEAGDFVWDSSLARRHLGWDPRSFDERLRETVEWYVAHYGT